MTLPHCPPPCPGPLTPLSVLLMSQPTEGPWHRGDTFRGPPGPSEGCCSGLQILLNNQLCERRQQLPGPRAGRAGSGGISRDVVNGKAGGGERRVKCCSLGQGLPARPLPLPCRPSLSERPCGWLVPHLLPRQTCSFSPGSFPSAPRAQAGGQPRTELGLLALEMSESLSRPFLGSCFQGKPHTGRQGTWGTVASRVPPAAGPGPYTQQ